MTIQTSPQRVRAMLAEVCSLPLADGDAERIELIGALEELTAGVAAASHAAAVDLESARIARDAADGVPAARRGRGTAEEVALARRCSPGAASRDLTVSRTLCRDLTGVHGLLATGRISAWSARVVAAEVAVLDAADRRVVDERLCASGELPGWSPAQARAATARLVAEIDAEAAVKRASRARGDRRVSLRPQPDTMVSLTALLPVEQGVAAWASLEQHARAARAAGDPRSVDQVRADTLVERLTGQPTAAAVPIEVHLVMDERSLLPVERSERDRAASMLDGLAPVPAPLARRLVAGTDRGDALTWVRRLRTDPITRSVTAVDDRRRLFPEAVKRLVRARDQRCRVPYCTAPIRHGDHAHPYADGGTTTPDNALGACERHNLVKEDLGWTAVPDPGTGVVRFTTSTGHTYASHPPPALGPTAGPPDRPRPTLQRFYPRVDHHVDVLALHETCSGPVRPIELDHAISVDQ